MAAVGEQTSRTDKTMKRGLLPSNVLDHQNCISSCISFPVCSGEAKSTCQPRFRLWRGYEEWAARNYILAIVSLLAVFALSCSFMFADSMRRSTKIIEEIDTHLHPKLSLSDQNSWATDHLWKRSGLRSEEGDDLDRTTADSTSSFLTNVDRHGVPHTVGGDGMVPFGCNEKRATLKVFMYDLPPEFHYGMLVEHAFSREQPWPKNATDIPPYLGGLYKQHSPEYWLTTDILTSNMAGRQSACTAFRVSDWKKADFMFVPFFASVAYNKYTKTEHHAGGELDLVGDKNQKLQERLFEYLKQQPAWQASDGSDHILVMHHPNSMHAMRNSFRDVMFVVADFGRYPPDVANVEKDVVAPYKHIIASYDNDSSSFEDREILLFFQGTIVRKQGGVIRQQLYEMLKDEKGVHFEEGSSSSEGVHSATLGMRGSKFCLNIAGDTPSSNRLFDSIASHCVPVIISDDIELPFEDELDYSEFCVFIKSEDALKENFVINLLRSISRDQWTHLWMRLKAVSRHFEYQHPTKPYDAVNMVWRAIARRAPSVKLSLHKKNHFLRSLQT